MVIEHKHSLRSRIMFFRNPRFLTFSPSAKACFPTRRGILPLRPTPVVSEFQSIEIPIQEPPKGLFDRIIAAIKREQELRQTKRLLFGFLFLLGASLVATPLSWTMLVSQVGESGILYFVSAAVSDFGTFFALWQDFGLAILESLPITGILAFVLSIGMAVFTLRLFLHRKRLLLGYLKQSFV